MDHFLTFRGRFIYYNDQRLVCAKQKMMFGMGSSLLNSYWNHHFQGLNMKIWACIFGVHRKIQALCSFFNSRTHNHYGIPIRHGNDLQNLPNGKTFPKISPYICILNWYIELFCENVFCIQDILYLVEPSRTYS